MLSAEHAKLALELNLGNTIKVGNPVPFAHGYDNYTGGSASISNFNSLMRGGGTFGILGTFGSVGAPQNLSSNFPIKNSAWSATSFTTTGGGATKTWIGTAISLNDVTIDIDVVTHLFTGTIGAYATIAGTASVSAGVWRVVSGTITIPTLFTNIFYGKVSWGMTNDNLGVVNYQILLGSYFDLLGNDYEIALNSAKTLGIAPVVFDSLQGDFTGTVSSIYMAGKNNIYFDGYIFALRAN